jgi:hypothetical protein
MIWARTRVLWQQTLAISVYLSSSSLPSCLVFFPSTLICFLLRHHPTPLFAAWRYKSLPPVPPGVPSHHLHRLATRIRPWHMHI